MRAIPIWKSHYSIGKSIFTLKEAGDTEPNYPDSIFDMAKEQDLKKIFLVEENMASFLEALQNSKASEIELCYGVRLTICSDMFDKTDDSRKTEHRAIVFMRNGEGYRDLVKIYSASATDGFYYVPRIDAKKLKELWNDKTLLLVIPFYDSFISNNLLQFHNCIPDFSFTSPIFFIEDNDLPFDKILVEAVYKYIEGQKVEPEIVKTKTIYYKNRKDFKTYLTFRCIHNRATLAEPNFDRMSSQEFCLEAWKEQNA